MMRSMFTGVSSLKTHQTKMDVIAHNIANVNTIGFKSSRVTFNEVFSQTTQGASRANETTGRGGTNPMQIGLGVNVASIDRMMGTGAAQRTDRALDVMINGDGFLIVGDESGTYFTRAGALNLDAQGNLLIGNGMRVYGWDAYKDTTTGEYKIQKTTVAPLKIGADKQQIEPTKTERIEIEGNLNANAIKNSADGTHLSTISIFDSIGTRYTVDVTWRYIDDHATMEPYWVYTIGDEAYINGDRKQPIDINSAGLGDEDRSGAIVFDGYGAISKYYDSTHLDYNAVTNRVEYDAAVTPATTPTLENVVGPPPVKADFTIDFVIDDTNTNPPAFIGDSNGAIKVDFNYLTQYNNFSTSAKFNSIDGNSAGKLSDMSVGPDGIITGLYSNGDTRILGQIPIALFKNPAGLESYGNNLFRETANSGVFDGTGDETGDMMGGVLEMSNVDLGSEFTEMITTQRGFQAGSRLITTSDDMIQELVNLKR